MCMLQKQKVNECTNAGIMTKLVKPTGDTQIKRRNLDSVTGIT